MVGGDGAEPGVGVGVQVLDLAHDGGRDHDVLQAVGALQEVDLLQNDVCVNDGIVPVRGRGAQVLLLDGLEPLAGLAVCDPARDVVAQVPFVHNLLHGVSACLAVVLVLCADDDIGAAVLACVKHHSCLSVLFCFCFCFCQY